MWYADFIFYFQRFQNQMQKFECVLNAFLTAWSSLELVWKPLKRIFTTLFLPLLKRRERRCFPVKFAKLLRTLFLYRIPLVAASDRKKLLLIFTKKHHRRCFVGSVFRAMSRVVRMSEVYQKIFLCNTVNFTGTLWL